MRGIGVLGLLISVAILCYVWASHTSEVAKVNKDVRPQLQQLAGQDENGRRVTETYSLSEVNSNGKLAGLRVDKMDADSAMRSFFGLKEGDVIVEVSSHGSPFKARDLDADMMKAYVAEAYQMKQPLVVERGGQTITLQPSTSKPGAAPAKKDPNDVNSTLEGITAPR